MSAAVIGDIIDALAGVLSCSREVIELAVMTLVAGGHLLPSDLTGVSVYSQATGSFDFHPGPLFANIVIADEVNRANPKAQSAMLEAMGEGQISVDGHTHGLRQIRSIERVRDIRAACRRVTLAPEMASYIVAPSAATRDAQGVRFGVSPRGSLNVAAMTRARALMQGRDFVMADDERLVVVTVLAHRGSDGVEAGRDSARRRRTERPDRRPRRTAWGGLGVRRGARRAIRLGTRARDGRLSTLSAVLPVASPNVWKP